MPGDWWEGKGDHWQDGGVQPPPGKPWPWSQVPDGCMPVIPPQCPRCSSTSVRTYGSPLPMRYHTCSQCSTQFKSFEVKLL